MATETQNRIKAGDRIVFGEYSGRPIRWRVLDRDGDCILLVSEQGLEARPYHTKYEEAFWDGCSLRRWLNGEFIQSAFHKAEQNMLQPRTLPEAVNSRYGTRSGETADKVFLLSAEEAERYFGGDEDRICFGASEPAPERAAPKEGCRWWLRTPGGSSGYAAYTAEKGWISLLGTLTDGQCMVRPAVWIDLAAPEKRAGWKSGWKGTLAPGRVLTFGEYKGKPIRWLVLDRAAISVGSGYSVLLVSEYILDILPYNADGQNASWEDCSLYKWLNGPFLKNAFDPAERKMIKSSVNLLSKEDAEDYFADDIDRRGVCVPSAYMVEAYSALKRDRRIEASPVALRWWLRQTKNAQFPVVEYGGSISGWDHSVLSYLAGVRPAVWIDLAAE